MALSKKCQLSKSPKATLKLAKDFAAQLRPGDIVGLIGPLGSGKTLFVKGLCEGLGIDAAEVSSPTFTLIHHYRGTMPVYHFDTYRLGSDKEFEDLGYEEQFYGDGISVVEWADKVDKFLPKGSYMLEFEVAGEKSRRITFGKKIRRSR